MPFLSNSGRAFLCCRDTVLPLHSDSGMHPFMEAIWLLILSRYIGSSNKWPNATASRYVSDANANSPKKAGMRKKRGAEGSSSLSCTVKKCGKTKQTVYTVTVFYNNRKMIGSRTNARPPKG